MSLTDLNALKWHNDAPHDSSCTALFIQLLSLSFHPFSARPSPTQSALWPVNMRDDWRECQWGRGQMSQKKKKETIKAKGGTEWIHSADHDIARGTCANNRPLSLDLGVFVQNYTEALCSQTPLETALMFIQIPDECRITVTFISSLVPRDKRKALAPVREN